MKFLQIITIKIFFFSIILGNYLHASITSKILAKVGEEIVTSFELENKIKSTLLLSGRQFTQDNVNRIKNLSLKSLINSKLKINEIKGFNLESQPLAIENHIRDVSRNIGIDPSTLKKLFIKNNINYDLYISEIETEFLWQKFILQIYSDKISIDKNQIDTQLELTIKEVKNINEFNLAEIEVESESSLDNKRIIKEIRANLLKDGFENTAMKYNLSSSMNKSTLGWINSNSLSEDILNIIKDMKPGEITEPIVKVNKIIFLKLIDKRIISNKENLDIKKIKESLINQKKRELLNLYSTSHLSKKRNTTIIEINAK